MEQIGLKQEKKSNTTDNKDYLIEYEEQENTPFTVVKKVEENDDINYYVMFGKYRISEAIKDQEEARKNAKIIDWWKIMSVAHVIAENLIEQQKIDTNLKKV